MINFMKSFFKKRLAALAASVMLITSIAIPAVSNAAFSDVEDSNAYKTAITTLSKLKIINGYDDGTFGPKKDITRAEFTKIVVYVLGYDELQTTIDQFEDLSLSHWANTYVKTAYDLGIINGYDDFTFGPDDPVTYEQALKMVVCMLGYQTDAEAKGGYPEGYRSESLAIDLQKGISGIEYTANAPREIVAQVMYNALEVKLRENNGRKWEATNKTLLNDYLEVYKIKATVVGVEESTTADCSVNLGPGQMAVRDSKTNEEHVIDYTPFASSITAMTPYLGQTVQIYYRLDDDDKFLVEIDNETSRNEEFTISSFDIADYSDLSIKYYPDAGTQTKTVKLDKSDYSVRYNGRAVTEPVDILGESYSLEEMLKLWLDPDSEFFIYGTARIIDSGADGTYNILDIYDYDTIAALSTPTSPDYLVSDKTVAGYSLPLNPDAADYKFSLTRDGKDITPSSIRAGDVITYAANLDGDYLSAYVTSNSVTGTITALNTTTDSAEERTVSIDNVKYHVSERFLEYIKNKEQRTLETGMQITAYTDYLGTLEWGTVTKSTSNYSYAYVVDATEDHITGYLKLFAPTSTTAATFTSSTSYKVKKFKIQEDNPKLNNKKSTPEAILATLKANAENLNPDADIAKISGVKLTGYNQLIKVGFNSSGEISEVITLDQETTGSNNEDNNKLVMYKQMDPAAKYYVTSSAVKASATGSLYYSLKSTTPMFVIPKDRTKVNDYSLKSAITTNSMVANSSYYLDAYDLSTTKYPTVLVVYNSSFKSGDAISRTSAYKLLSDNIKQEFDTEDGDTYDMLYTYNSATTVSKAKIGSEYSDLFADLVKGDVVLTGVDSDKLTDSVMVAVRYNDIKQNLAGYATEVKGEDGEESRYEYFNWRMEQEQTEANNWQKYVYDFRYPKSGQTEASDNYFVTGGNGTGIASRAFMCNIMQVLSEENKLYVTQDGFDELGTLDENNYLEIKLSSSTKIVRYDADEEQFTPYVKGTDSTLLTKDDLKGSDNYGINCSKVLITYVSSSTGNSSTSPTAKFIVIYGE